MSNTHRPSDEELFAEALRQTTPEARAAYLQGALAGDEPRRQRIAALLQAHDNAGQFLEAPPAAVPANTIPLTTGMIAVTEKAGDKIGHYKLREQIGEGGCGVVYVAEQQEPVRRRVALKIIKMFFILLATTFPANAGAVFLPFPVSLPVSPTAR